MNEICLKTAKGNYQEEDILFNNSSIQTVARVGILYYSRMVRCNIQVGLCAVPQAHCLVFSEFL